MNIEFEIPDLSMFDVSIQSDRFTTRYMKPKKMKEMPSKMVKYRNAQKLANDIGLDKGMSVICIVDGTFIAGDFIEAFIKKHNLHIKRMTISTLSLNNDNVDSLANLLFDDWVDTLDIIVSDGFYANYIGDTIKYIYQELDKDDRFQLAVARVHTKITTMESHCGKKIVIKGSANLRSSQSIEHLEVLEDSDVFDFFEKFHDHIIETYKTINKEQKQKKGLTRKESWQAEI